MKVDSSLMKQQSTPSYNTSTCGTLVLADTVVCRCTSLGSFSAVFVSSANASQITRFYDKMLFIDLKSQKKLISCLGSLFMIGVMGILGLIMLMLLAQQKDVTRRETVIMEYIKFLVLWKMKIENQENDLVIMKEEIQLMEELKRIYDERVSKKAVFINMM
jgi:hypothetical protein